jgi:hypothetical protein
MPAGGGAAHPLTRGGGYTARETPDGRWLYFTRWDEPGLWRRALAGDGAADGAGAAAERVLADGIDARRRDDWALTSEGVYYVDHGSAEDGAGVHLALWSPERRAVVRRTPLGGEPVRPSLGLTPDGRGAVLAELDRVVSDLVLAEEIAPDEPCAVARRRSAFERAGGTKLSSSWTTKWSITCSPKPAVTSTGWPKGSGATSASWLKVLQLSTPRCASR